MQRLVALHRALQRSKPISSRPLVRLQVDRFVDGLVFHEIMRDSLRELLDLDQKVRRQGNVVVLLQYGFALYLPALKQ